MFHAIDYSDIINRGNRKLISDYRRACLGSTNTQFTNKVDKVFIQLLKHQTIDEVKNFNQIYSLHN